MTTPLVVGVDVGSSSTRAVALDREGGLCGSAQSSLSPATSTGELDPRRWVEGFAAVLTELAVSNPVAIGVGGFGPVTVAAGGQGALTFRYAAGDVSDPRDQHAAQAAELRRRHGTAPRLLWDWLVGAFTGRSEFQSVWPGDAPLPGFGEPFPVGHAVGISDGSHGVVAGIPLVPATNDAYLSAWAVGMDRPGRGFDPGGRTGGLGIAIESTAEAAPYGMPSAVPGVVLVGGPVAAHGAMLDWWSRTVQRSASDLLVGAESVAVGSAGVLVLPFLEGERAPRWDPRLRAEIVGLHEEHGVNEVTRAILECTAYGLRHIADAAAAEGARLERLVSCGKPSQSRLWVEIKSSVLGVPVDVPDHPETAAYGAALAAGAAAGWWPPPGEGRTGDWPIPSFSVFEADPDPVHEARYERFVALGDAAEARLD